LNPTQATILSYQAITFALGSHFNCPPHFWDNMPPDRVMLDYMIVRAASEKKAEMIDRMKKEAERQAKYGRGNKGQPLRTTSDGENLSDFFERHNAKLTGE
jgi:hypothetical protein